MTRFDAFALFLERSKAAPLHIDVNYSYSDAGRNPSSLDLLPPLSSRIRPLSADDDIPRLQAFSKQLTRPLERLESLVLTSRMLWFDPWTPPPVTPFVPAKELTPRLHHLELDRLPFRWSDPVFYSSLTTSKVTTFRQDHRFGPDRPDVGTIMHLLDVLERIAPRLEALNLNPAIPMSESEPRTASSFSLPLVPLTSFFATPWLDARLCQPFQPLLLHKSNSQCTP